MSAFEYLLPFVSILVGLAVADLSVSLHRLLRARRRVRWDWLPLAASALVLLLILQFWWSFFHFGQGDLWSRYGPFMLLTVSLVSIFLLASAALPDEVPETGVDLRAYYLENGPYFWGLFAAFMVLATVTNGLPVFGRIPPAELVASLVPNLILVVLLGSLAVVRSRLYHAVLVLFLLVMLGLHWSQLQLGAPL